MWLRTETNPSFNAKKKKKKISKIGGKFVRFRAAVTGWVGGRQRVNFRGNKQGVRDTPGQRER